MGGKINRRRCHCCRHCCSFADPVAAGSVDLLGTDLGLLLLQLRVVGCLCIVNRSSTSGLIDQSTREEKSLVVVAAAAAAIIINSSIADADAPAVAADRSAVVVAVVVFCYQSLLLLLYSCCCCCYRFGTMTNRSID